MIGLLVLALATQATAIPKVIVTVAEPETVRVEAGGHVEAGLTVTIAEGFRIQANPAAEPFLIPASLELEDDERMGAGPVEYPPGKPHRLRGASSDLSVYEGTFVIKVPLEASRPASAEAESIDVVLEGRLRYQACNEMVCLKPSSAPVKVPVRIRRDGRSHTR